MSAWWYAVPVAVFLTAGAAIAIASARQRTRALLSSLDQADERRITDNLAADIAGILRTGPADARALAQALIRRGHR